MKEYFESRKLSGNINVACKFEGQPTRYWTTTKEQVVRNIINIVSAYASEGELLTLRQLHYQFVGHVAGYVNHDSAYKKLGNILDDLRYCGKVPWNAFEDRGRKPYIPYSVKDIEDALQDAIDTYRIDRQEGQKVYIELWTEKDALSAIFRKSTNKYHIHLVINKGYTSSTAAYEAYRRCSENILQDKKVVILYFGDHDPSGLDMVRDIRERLLFFICNGEQFQRNDQIENWYEEQNYNIYDICELTDNETLIPKLFADEPEGDDINKFEALKVQLWLQEKNLFEIRHIGLTMSQIKKFNLPENPTKMTDTRSDGYVKKYGKKCWEVDALDILELRRIVESNVEEVIDLNVFKKVVAREKKEIKQLSEIIKKIK